MKGVGILQRKGFIGAKGRENLGYTLKDQVKCIARGGY